ncbi:MAG TPA: hypothetical protein VGF32_33065 [Streptosporangiaceae bacterium]|jgi:hypothetical protein
MNVWDLRGDARDLYDQWRRVGLTEAQALEEVERSGILTRQDLAEQFEGLGLSPEAARYAAQGRHGEPLTAHPFDQLVECFMARGMTREAATTAAIGRECRDETEAREAFAESAAERYRARQSTGGDREFNEPANQTAGERLLGESVARRQGRR